MIWRKRVAMNFSYMMLDIRSISFQKYKNKIKFLGDIQFLSHMSYKFEKPFMQLVFSLSFVKLLWPFERITSYTHDQDHVHVHSYAILLHLKDSKYIHPPTNKTPCCTMSISLQSYCYNVWAIQKEEIKDAYPKKVCHMPTRHVKKKRKEKRKIVHIHGKKWREIRSYKGVHPPKKIPTHLHILIRLYD